MIRINTLFMLIILGIFLSACAWMTQKIESTEVISKISARRIGAEIQFKYPVVAKEIHKVCTMVLVDIDNEEPEALKYYIHELLQQHIGEPLLVADIIDLIDIIEIKPNLPLDEEQVRIVKTIAEGFISGIELSGGKYGTEAD